MLFRSTIGTWCKGTTNLRGTKKVAIAMAFKLLATYLQLTCNLLVVILFPKYKNY